jgi:gliding motility-associated-like protein
MRPFLLLLVYSISWCFVKAQSNTNWNMMDNNLINFSTGIPVVGSQKLKNYNHSASLSDSRGRLILYTNGREVRDGNHNLIANGVIPSYNGGGFSAFLQLNDSVYYLIETRILKGKKGLVYSKIIKSKNELGIDTVNKLVYLKYGNDQLFSSGDLGIIATCRDTNGSYFFTACINDTFFNYRLDTSFTLVNFLPCKTFLSLQRPNWSDSLRYTYNTSSFFDRMGNNLYIYTYELIQVKKLLNQTVDLPITNTVSIYKLPFDKSTGLFNVPELVYIKNTGYKNYPNFKLNDEWELESRVINYDFIVFSANDSLLYFNTYNYKVRITNQGIKYVMPDDTLILNQLNPFSKMHFTLGINYYFEDFPFGLLMPSPDGKIYYLKTDPNNKSIYLDVINSPKLFGKGCNLKLNAYAFTFPSFITSGELNIYTIFDFIRFKYNITYDCKANIQFTNNSFSEARFSNFTWFINKLNGQIDTLKGATPSLTIIKSGKYPYKVFGKSDVKNYGEWYYDTLFVNIPEKPISNFKAKDTIICRYLPLQFKNLCTNKEIKPNTQETYVWTFGDGTTSNDKEPIHTYTKPGTYTVSLFYSNGYCDSTLVKNQYIRVVDAPKPGFKANTIQGCVPFITSITDTVTLNVTKKEYLFSDSAKWKTIRTSQFNYTFNKPGHYWAVQKLYGYTGCIIRTDSIQFFVSKGILPSDSIAITEVSYDTLNQLHLTWQSHPAATSYSIFKGTDGVNYSLLSNTDKLFTIDSKANKNAFYYKVVAKDSCGKLSNSLNQVKPQFISGQRLPQNEAAIINYKGDEGLGIPQSVELEWTYQHAINLIHGETNPINPFKDENFVKSGYLKKCYRYTATHNGIKMYSNYECINFEPQSFIPNSFSPNGDGLNDMFVPTLLGIISYNIKIFDRWGQLIYSGNTPWDGMIKGYPAEGEVYMFVIGIVRNDEVNEIHKGIVHLIR